MEGLRVLELVERPFLFEPALRPFERPQGPQAQGPCFLEIQVSLALLDAIDAALQLVQELRVDVFEVVLDELPGLGGLLWHSICDLVWQVNPKHLTP